MPVINDPELAAGIEFAEQEAKRHGENKNKYLLLSGFCLVSSLACFAGAFAKKENVSTENKGQNVDAVLVQKEETAKLKNGVLLGSGGFFFLSGAGFAGAALHSRRQERAFNNAKNGIARAREIFR